MPTALLTAGLPSQPHQGVGARLVRRLGGAVRSAIVGGIALAGALRRPAVSQTSRDRAAAQDPQAPAPRRVSVPHPPRATLPAPPPLPPLLAHLLARRERRSASVSRPACLGQGDVHFTPEAFPQLSPKACAVLNTPLKDCDPKTLDLVVSTFTQYVNQVMSPEVAPTDRAATLPNLWHRLSTALGDPEADTSPLTPAAESATPADAAPDAPVASPNPPVEAPPTAPTRLWTNQPPPVSPVPLSGPPASDQPPDATTNPTTPETTPEIAAPSAPVMHGGRPLSNSGRPFRYHTQSFARWRRRLVRCCRALFPPGVRDGLPCPPPPWKLYYAACTGPP
jgi:hypothetical protein